MEEKNSMEKKRKETAVVYSQKETAGGIFDMWISTSLAKNAHPGQFISIYPKNEATLLPRPISICEVDERKERLRIVYRVAGQGTKEFSGYKQGDNISVLGILGNGFPLDAAEGKTVFLMGGGIGIPPMLQLAKELAMVNQKNGRDNSNIKIILGYRSELFLHEDLKQYGEVYIATEDGSTGSKGTVMNAIEDNHLKGDVIFSCGPMPMLRAIKEYAAENGMTAYLSLEERMACGVGACLGCVCKTKEVDHHSFVHNARVCTDGPVYPAEEVDI